MPFVFSLFNWMHFPWGHKVCIGMFVSFISISITKRRTEVIFKGTNSSDPESPLAVWEEYEFKCKPGDIHRQPCLISPYHYRLDWLMWFAAFQASFITNCVLFLSVRLCVVLWFSSTKVKCMKLQDFDLFYQKWLLSIGASVFFNPLFILMRFFSSRNLVITLTHTNCFCIFLIAWSFLNCFVINEWKA